MEKRFQEIDPYEKVVALFKKKFVVSRVRDCLTLRLRKSYEVELDAIFFPLLVHTFPGFTSSQRQYNVAKELLSFYYSGYYHALTTQKPIYQYMSRLLLHSVITPDYRAIIMPTSSFIWLDPQYFDDYYVHFLSDHCSFDLKRLFGALYVRLKLEDGRQADFPLNISYSCAIKTNTDVCQVLLNTKPCNLPKQKYEVLSLVVRGSFALPILPFFTNKCLFSGSAYSKLWNEGLPVKDELVLPYCSPLRTFKEPYRSKDFQLLKIKMLYKKNTDLNNMLLKLKQNAHLEEPRSVLTPREIIMFDVYVKTNLKNFAGNIHLDLNDLDVGSLLQVGKKKPFLDRKRRIWAVPKLYVVNDYTDIFADVFTSVRERDCVEFLRHLKKIPSADLHFLFQAFNYGGKDLLSHILEIDDAQIALEFLQLLVQSGCPLSLTGSHFDKVCDKTLSVTHGHVTVSLLFGHTSFFDEEMSTSPLELNFELFKSRFAKVDTVSSFPLVRCFKCGKFITHEKVENFDKVYHWYCTLPSFKMVLLNKKYHLNGGKGIYDFVRPNKKMPTGCEVVDLNKPYQWFYISSKTKVPRALCVSLDRHFHERLIIPFMPPSRSSFFFPQKNYSYCYTVVAKKKKEENFWNQKSELDIVLRPTPQVNRCSRYIRSAPPSQERHIPQDVIDQIKAIDTLYKSLQEKNKQALRQQLLSLKTTTLNELSIEN